MFCPKCKAEYQPGYTRCSDCGVQLVDDLPEAEDSHPAECDSPQESQTGCDPDQMSSPFCVRCGKPSHEGDKFCRVCGAPLAAGFGRTEDVRQATVAPVPEQSPSDSPALDKGRHLEREVARVLSAGGYEVDRNVIREGRSGAHHEVDVLAQKQDGFTSFSVMVECKAWSKRVDKEVIAKAAHVARDIGASKSIVVSLEGATLGAMQTAEQLGVEVWGPEELERHLGRVAVADISTQAKRLAKGLQFTVDRDTAYRAAEKERSKGLLGLGQERFESFNQVWIPCLVVRLGCSRLDGHLRKRTKHTTQFNVYEMLSGGFLWRDDSEPELCEIDLSPHYLPPQVRTRSLCTGLVQTFSKWSTAVQDAARKRHALNAWGKGIPVPLSALTADEAVEFFLPTYVGLAEAKGKKRVVVVDALNGKRSELLSRVLTANLHFLTDALDANVRQA